MHLKNYLKNNILFLPQFINGRDNIGLIKKNFEAVEDDFRQRFFCMNSIRKWKNVSCNLLNELFYFMIITLIII